MPGCPLRTARLLLGLDGCQYGRQLLLLDRGQLGIDLSGQRGFLLDPPRSRRLSTLHRPGEIRVRRVAQHGDAGL